MKIGCYIVDDEVHAIDILKDYVASHSNLELLGSATDPVEGLKDVNNLVPDLIFLDINMPDLGGLNFCKLITNKKSKVVFTTAYKNFAFEAFENNAFDYMLKPISPERFIRCIQKYELVDEKNLIQLPSPKQPKSSYIYIKNENKGKLKKIDFESIYYIESSDNYITIKLLNSQYFAYLTLKEIAEHLPSEAFVRVHKSFIVNQNKISHINGNQIFLTDNTILQIGTMYKTIFFDMIDPMIIKSARS